MNGEEVEVDVLGPGSVIGEVFLKSSVPRRMSVRAARRSDILMLTQGDCQIVLKLYPSSLEMFMCNSEQEHIVW